MAEANWITEALGRIDAHGAVVRASLIGVKGSAPREAGAMMLISPDDIWQTIGGGTLEFEVMQQARALLADRPADAPTGSPENASWHRRVTTAALGPDMGQCCGGVVRLLLECFSAAERPVLRELAALPGPVVLAHPLAGGVPLVCAAPPASPATSPTAADGKIVLGLSADKTHFLACRDLPRRPAFVYGAGHIGRALVGILASLDLDVHWIDIRPNRFPAVIPDGVRRVIAADPSMIAGHAPPDAIHLVITHNHALDQAICHKLLAGDGFARLGLIGSATKSARFRQRLTRAGISRDRLDRLVCPIGIPAITGKQPARVALSIAARVAIWQQELNIAHNSRDHIAAPVTA